MIFLFLLIMMVAQVARAWDVDWSHHQQKQPDSSRAPASDAAPANDSGTSVSSGEVVNGVPNPTAEKPHRKILDGLVQPTHQTYVGDRQEFVILNTAKGFVPNNVRLHKGLHYVVHIVNVNEDKKNVSFMLDAFDQHYATYYGQIRSFDLDPDKEGIFDFQCPETNSSGKLVVLGTGPASPVRTISSDQK